MTAIATRPPQARAPHSLPDRRYPAADLLDEAVIDVPPFRAQVLDRARQDTQAFDRLTPRQAEVLALMAGGLTNAAIARRLRISEKAVVGHASHIYDAFTLPPSPDTHRRVLAVLRFHQRW